MTILFLARHYTYFRNFDAAIRLLAERGHRVHLAVDREDNREFVERLVASTPGVTFGPTPEAPVTRRTRLSEGLRLALDFLRYEEPRYADAPKIRQRAAERTPKFAAWARDRWGVDGAGARIAEVENAIGPSPRIREFIGAIGPDLVMITPLIELGSPQLDYLRAARALRIPTALAVWSWDHLTSKALIRVRPDRVLVWNETQKREAVDLHGLPPEMVVVTGAQCFDQWFDRQPSLGREAFCQRVGLPDARPFALYVCSSLFKGSPPESGFVRRWIHTLRQHGDARLRDLPIVVRPHPQRLAEWEGVDLAGEFPGVHVFGSNPLDARTRADYFDSMYHAAVVTGLNTSALIEAAIVDRPVYTVLLPEFRENQEGTLHFQYLLQVGEGFLHTSRSLEEHARQLLDGLAGRTSSRNAAFVEAFIRPAGRHLAATPRFVDAVEASAVLTAGAPERTIPSGRLAAAALAAVMDTPWGLRWLGDPREIREREGRAAVQADRARRYADKYREQRLALWRHRRARLIAAAKTIVLKVAPGLSSRGPGLL
ncbi:MAG: hypothetical protein AB7I25_01685 [Vicinamibacterales bacterium]